MQGYKAHCNWQSCFVLFTQKGTATSRPLYENERMFINSF